MKGDKDEGMLQCGLRAHACGCAVLLVGCCPATHKPSKAASDVCC
jgi:hypothetical protein